MEYELSNNADKFLENLSESNKKDVRRILNKIQEIIENPYNFKYLKKEGKYRKARVGKYRIIFTITDDNICSILLIGSRKNIYKKFNQ